MRWKEAREAYSAQRLVIVAHEAPEAHSENGHRILDRIAVIEACADGPATMKRYGELGRAHPQRELCFVHTSRDALDIEELLWLGGRGLCADELCVVTSCPSPRRSMRSHHHWIVRIFHLCERSMIWKPRLETQY